MGAAGWELATELPLGKFDQENRGILGHPLEIVDGQHTEGIPDGAGTQPMETRSRLVLLELQMARGVPEEDMATGVWVWTRMSIRWAIGGGGNEDGGGFAEQLTDLRFELLDDPPAAIGIAGSTVEDLRDLLQRLLRCGSTVTDQESGAFLTQLVDARFGVRRVHRSRQAIGDLSQTRSVDASEELVVGPIPAEAELPWSEAEQRV